jgi:hypothetical protein
LPNKNEPVQKQPANDRPVEGQGTTKDEREQEQPADNKRALMVGLKGTKRQRPSIAKGPPDLRTVIAIPMPRKQGGQVRTKSRPPPD